ncbi:MAG TPA: methionyl-tRNA formyltransferase [Candidatus Polarisedimenticolaceae bacterium]|nr:methionyl-tRNA formyltransferase [Candidatus Polarisedimenticolaceae bacterium]
MRVAFFGTPETAVPTLDALLRHGVDVALVVTRADRPVGRSRTPRPPAVKVRAGEVGLPVVQPESVKDPAFAAALEAAAPDALVVVAYGRLLPQGVLDAAPHGAINVHFSMLPALRGAAPVAWALARGARETGVSTFRLDRGLDTGDVLLQEAVPILPREHAPALLARLAVTGAELLVRTLDGLAAGTIVPHPQDGARATYAPILTRGDGAWDPGWTAADLEGRVRGFDPWPGVWSRCAGRRLRLAGAVALDGDLSDAPAGTLLDALRLACADGTVAALEAVQFEGRRVVTAREAAAGRQLAPGDRLERIEPAA